jgi:hypothetical protein
MNYRWERLDEAEMCCAPELVVDSAFVRRQQEWLHEVCQSAE